MTWTSAVPAAVDGLLAAFRLSPDLAAPVAVRDGPVVTGSQAADVVVAGWYGTEQDELAVEGQDTPEGLGGGRDREQFSVRCAAMSTNSGGDAAAALTAARVRVYVLVAACGAAVAADRTLGGAVMRATMGASSLRQVPGTDGITALVEFTVDCDAYSGR